MNPSFESNAKRVGAKNSKVETARDNVTTEIAVGSKNYIVRFGEFTSYTEEPVEVAEAMEGKNEEGVTSLHLISVIRVICEKILLTDHTDNTDQI